MNNIGFSHLVLLVLFTTGNATELSKEQSTPVTIFNGKENRTHFPSYSPMKILTRYIVPTIFGVIFVIGLVGNSLVILVIFRNGHMIDSTNILISSLALADLTFIVFCIPLTMDIYIRMGWIWGNFLCMLYQYLTSLTVYCSVYTLVLMSIDRYMAVVHPITSVSWRTKTRSLMAVYVLWSILILLNLPFLIFSGVLYIPIGTEKNNQTINRYFCAIKLFTNFNESLKGYVEDLKVMSYYYFCFFLVAFLIPLGIIIILYCLILFRISKRLHNQQSANIIRANRKVTKLVVSVIIAFGVSWLPLHIVFLIQATFGDPRNVAFRSFHIIANSMAYGNSMINPILYAFLSDNFRKAFWKFLTLKYMKCFQSSDSSNRGNSITMAPETRTKCETIIPLIDPNV